MYSNIIWYTSMTSHVISCINCDIIVRLWYHSQTVISHNCDIIVRLWYHIIVISYVISCPGNNDIIYSIIVWYSLGTYDIIVWYHSSTVISWSPYIAWCSFISHVIHNDVILHVISQWPKVPDECSKGTGEQPAQYPAQEQHNSISTEYVLSMYWYVLSMYQVWF